MTIAPAGTAAISGQASYTAGATIQITAPTGIAVGEFLLGVLDLYAPTSAGTATIPTGWTSIGSLSNGQSNYLFYKIATSADVGATSYGAVTAGGTGTQSWTGGIQRLSGGDTTTPIDAGGSTVDSGYTGTTATQTITLPSVTTATANAWQLAFVSLDDPYNNQASEPLPSGWTALFDDSTGTPTRAWRVAYRPIAAPGATGTSTWTWTAFYTAPDLQGITFALRPAPSAPQPPRLVQRAARIRSAHF